MPLNGQKLSQTVEVTQADVGHYLPIFKPNVSNERIKVFELLNQLVDLVDAYTISETNALLSTKANDSDVVHKAGSETIPGTKTFGTFPVLPNYAPSGDYQAAHKKYVDDLITVIVDLINDINLELQNLAIDSEVVHKTGDESINGIKTFSDIPILPIALPTIDEQATSKKYVDQEISALVTIINGIINSLNDFALDTEVVHKNGDETINGVKSFIESPVVPSADASNEAVNKGQMDTADAALQSQITANNADKWFVPSLINCSGNPNYPAAVKGKTWLVSEAGKIGGVNGRSVSVEDIILCIANNNGGSQALVGSSFTIIQGKLGEFIVANDFVTLRYFIGAGSAPGGYVLKPVGNSVQDSGLIDVTIYGMIFLDNVPVDLFEAGITHNELTGDLDFSSMGGLFDGQKIVLTTIKNSN